MEQYFGTQGGGVAVLQDGYYIFVELPPFGNFKIGDIVPSKWSLVGPYNLCGCGELTSSHSCRLCQEAWNKIDNIKEVKEFSKPTQLGDKP